MKNNLEEIKNCPSLTVKQIIDCIDELRNKAKTSNNFTSDVNIRLNNLIRSQ